MSKRTLSLSITILLDAELVPNNGVTDIQITQVRHNVMGIIKGTGDETTAEFRQAVGTIAAQHGLQYTLDELAGKHEGEAPNTNQPGADA